MVLAKILVLLSTLWAVIALTVQVVLAWGGGRHEYARRAGHPLHGAAYNFTAAMLPAHKESVSHHPVVSIAGMLMHAGSILALAGILLLIVWPQTAAWVLRLVCPLLWLSLLAALFLLLRRAFSSDLRAISAPDDYLACLATCGLLAFGALFGIANQQAPFLVYTAGLLIYLPLGKLRHAIFFFFARGDFGRRLGYRGTYPPVRDGRE